MLVSSPPLPFPLFALTTIDPPPPTHTHAKSPDFAFIAQLNFKYSINFIHIFNTVPDLSVFVVHLPFNPLNPALPDLQMRNL